ncbi:MAG: hypothetical protein M1827_001320 [Pycnora praestabilis]|nr:MAG: hypothetical protein M1827_001320 [Pycnora praestabilis]
MSSTPAPQSVQDDGQPRPPQIMVDQAAGAAIGSSEEQLPRNSERFAHPPKSPNRNPSSVKPNTSANQNIPGPPNRPAGSTRRVTHAAIGGLQVPGTEDDAGTQTGSGVQQPPVETVPPPAYSESYNQLDVSQDGFDTRATVASDGRVNININQKSRRLSNLLVPALRSQLHIHSEEHGPEQPPAYIPPSLGGRPGQAPPPPMNVVIHVVGSRGDVQPFVALGQVLKKTYGHRVRLATHPTFREFVEDNGLEFFSIGGDPAELMAFMVKNPGLMPGFETLRNGDVGKRRKGMYETFKGCWRSCIETGDGMGIEASDDNLDDHASIDSGISVGSDPSSKPFVADAIIANPPSFAHIHCAEKLGIPVHLMFTMPWSPTQAFPHPLANIQSTNADANMSNFVSYALVEMMTWQGLGDVVNRFREKNLGLEPISVMWAPGMASRLKIPYTYCWSPALIPKPKDWGSHITISGFYFLSLASNYTPAPDLLAFLEAGPPPVYIGFGSIVVDDPTVFTKLIFEAVKKAGVRALVSKGWGGIGGDALGIPDGVFMLGNVPHDWLFKNVSCVVHHGGAGTTAAGILLGRPTVVVPFFGDQPFWGAMTAKAGAGPLPIPYKHLTADNLAAAIGKALEPTALTKAEELGARMREEQGSDMGAQYFHDSLNVDTLRCLLAPSRVAVWRVKRTNIRLSALAATVLGNQGLLEFGDLKLYRPREYEVEDGPWDPITGGASALLGTIGSLAMGVADMPVEVLKALKPKSSDDGHSSGTGHSSIERTNSGIHTPGRTNSDVLTHTTSEPAPSSPSLNAESETRNASATQPSRDLLLSEEATESPRTSDSLHREEEIIPSSTTGSHSDVSSPISPPHHRSSLAQALSGNLSHDGRKSGSSSPTRRLSHHRTSSDSKITLDSAINAGRQSGRIVNAGLKSPMDFTLSIARGFHNAPKLYGDQTVRQGDKVTDFQSGMKAAGKEFGWGMYDGITGLVTQPIEGAKKEGFVGLVKGFGKGIGGIVLKPNAAVWSIPGYTFKGIYKEIQKHLGSSVQNYIIAARTAQGYEDWGTSTQEERLDIVSRWHTTKLDLQKGKHKAGDESTHGLHGFLNRINSCHDEHKEKNKKGKQNSFGHKRGSSHSINDDPPALQHAQTFPSVGHRDTQSAEFEEAIERSVTATSRGDPDEDKLIERAIRASLAELQVAQDEGDDHATIERAIQASVSQAGEAREQGASVDPLGDSQISGEELEKALKQSMEGSQHTSESPQQTRSGEFADSGIDTDDEENMRKAVEESKKQAAVSERAVYDAPNDEEELAKAIKESQKAHSEQEHAKTEEEIVMEYIKKQSLVEEEHRKARLQKDTTDQTEPDDDLKRAIAESMKGGSGTEHGSNGSA